MGRDKLEPGSWGDIQVAGYIEDGHRTYLRNGKTIQAKKYRRAKDSETPTIWRATCSYRRKDGRTRRASAWDTRKTRVAGKLRRRVQTLVGDFAPSKVKMTVELLGQEWIQWFEDSSKVRQQTLDQYRTILEGPISTFLGGYELRELTVGILTKALEDMAEGAPSRARKARIVLRHMYTYAIQNDYVDRNLADLTPTFRGPVVAPQAMTELKIQEIRRAMRAWQQTKKSYVSRSTSVPDALDFMLGTGCRTGEALAVRWEDITLGVNPTVTFSGTLVQRKNEGLVRQPLTKTQQGFRIVSLPNGVANMLLGRAANSPESKFVFPARGGGPMSPNNFRRAIRQALQESNLEGFYPYLFRKTVATKIADSEGLEVAAATLGHSDPRVTAAHYAERAVQAPDTSDILQHLFEETQ